MIKNIIIFVLLNQINSNNYFIALKYSQDLKNDTNYGVIGGTLGSYLNLNNNILITFFFQFNEFLNDVFPFISFFETNNIMEEYNFYKNSNIISTTNDFPNGINIIKNTIYFCKIEIKKDLESFNINLFIFDNYNNFLNINKIIKTQNEINDLILVINRHNLNEDLILENLIYYDCIDCYTNIELINGVSNILNFINFRHNYSNTKWLMNEIKNEFGPSWNGINNEFINMFNPEYDENNKEIKWISSSNFSQININPTLLTYLNHYKLFFSMNIFLKFDLFINHINEIDNNDYIYDILNFYNNKFRIKINKNLNSLKIVFSFVNNLDQNFLIHSKNIPNSIKINNKKLIDGNFFGIKFISINLNKTFNSNFSIKNYLLFKNNSIFCLNLICRFDNNIILNYDINVEKKLFIEWKNDYSRELYLSIWLKELILGSGNYNFDVSSRSLIIKSKNIINPFIIFNENFENLERRFNFYQEINHSNCLVSNCSICRNDLNVCELCYENYFLNGVNCNFNNKINTFVNSYSIFIEAKINNPNAPEVKIDSLNYYLFGHYLHTVLNNRLVYIYIAIENNSFNNVLVNIFSKFCKNEFNFFFNKLGKKVGYFNNYLLVKNVNCLNDILIYNYNKNSSLNKLINLKMFINSEAFNCIKNYKDLPCNFHCSRNDEYFHKFDNSLYYNTCDNNDLNYLTKNRGFFRYYYNCPNNCKKCIIDINNWIKCTICENGFILKNFECIIKIMVNCNLESNFNISNNNNANINLYNCTDFCNYIGNNSKVYNLIRFYKNNKSCNENDNISLTCLNNSLFYNYNSKNCESCLNGNCSNFKCNNCHKTNNIIPCSENYIFLNYKCILNNYYDINCENYNYDIDLKLLICSDCKNDYYINHLKNNKCYKRNTSHCNKYFENSSVCKNCLDTYFINDLNLCKNCDDNCLNCKSNSKNCLSCKFGYYLINNKCYKRNTLYCIKYFENSSVCKNCLDTYFINDLSLCKKCDDNCLNCKSNSKNCLSCKFGYYLKNNKCHFKEIYTNNCKIFKSNKFCSICNDGYFLNNSLICEICNKNCLKCINYKNYCLTCKKDYRLFKNECKNKIDSCLKYNEDIHKCDKCFEGFYLNKDFFCNQCDNNCLTCKNEFNNCLTCKKEGELINKNNNNLCKYKCQNNYFIFDLKLKKCIKCKIINFKEYKLYDKSFKFNKIEFEEFKIDTLKYRYFIIFDIPYYINEKLIDENKLDKNFKIILNKVYYEFELIYNINIEKRKILLIPIINSYLKNLTVTWTINNFIFHKFNECFFEKQKFILDIFNYNFILNNYKNEIDLKLIKNFETLNKNSTEYKKIDKYLSVSKTTTNSLFIGNFVLSVFTPSILSKLSIFLPTLLFFNYLILLKVNYGKNVNTILSFINFNPKIINFIKLDKKIVNKRISYLLLMNSKLKYLEIISIDSMTLNYLIMNGLIILLTIINLFKFVLIFLKKIIYYDNKLKNNKIKFFVKSEIDLIKKIELKKKYYKIKKNFIYIHELIIYYIFSLLFSELPNIILITIIYSSSFNIEVTNFSSIVINLIIFYNTMLLLFFFYSNLYLIDYFKYNKNKKILIFIKIFQYYKPFDSAIGKENDYINYFKTFENLRIIFSLTVILYLNYSVYIQLISLIIIQIIYLIFIYISISFKFFLVILLIKEFFILLFLFFTIYLKLSEINYLTEIIIIFIIFIIFILSIFEFAFINIKKGILLWSLLFKKIKLKLKFKKKFKNRIFKKRLKKEKIRALKNIKI